MTLGPTYTVWNSSPAGGAHQHAGGGVRAVVGVEMRTLKSRLELVDLG